MGCQFFGSAVCGGAWGYCLGRVVGSGSEEIRDRSLVMILLELAGASPSGAGEPSAPCGWPPIEEFY